MSIRIEVMPDGAVEIFRSWIQDGAIRWLRFPNAEAAIRVLPYLIRREERRVLQERFVPQLDRECAALLKRELKQREGTNAKT